MDPGMNGVETYKKIIKMHPSQKAILASGMAKSDQYNEVDLIKSLGIREVIQKPYNLKDIGIAIKKELTRQI